MLALTRTIARGKTLRPVRLHRTLDRVGAQGEGVNNGVGALLAALLVAGPESQRRGVQLKALTRNDRLAALVDQIPLGVELEPGLPSPLDDVLLPCNAA